MSFVVIVKVAGSSPPWSGLPADYPVACEEFDTLAEANKKHPGKLTMTTEKYREYAEHFHTTFPAPAETQKKKPWWQFWRRA